MTTPTPIQCEHGQLARSCEICELKRDLAAAQEEAKTLLAKLLHAEALLAGCSAYLKDGETPAERIQREIADCAAITRLYAAALKERDTAQEARQRAEALTESYMEILREVDDLIKYQYSGTREAMSYLQYIANRVIAAIAEGK